MRAYVEKFVFVLLIVATSICAVAARSGGTEEFEAVIADDLESHGWPTTDLFYKINVNYFGSYALTSVGLGRHGAAGQEFLLKRGSTGWSVIGEGGGEMNDGLLIDGYNVPVIAADHLLSGCDDAGRHKARTYRFASRSTRRVSFELKRHGKVRKIRFDAPRTLTICIT